MSTSAFTAEFLKESAQLIAALDGSVIDRVAEGLGAVRDGGGRLFILGVGGSAGHASHAVNDFRKICAFEAYAPTDNVSELTARINDEGWDTSFSEWLKGSRLSERDARSAEALPPLRSLTSRLEHLAKIPRLEGNAGQSVLVERVEKRR